MVEQKINLNKTRNISIFLGSSCNYSCSYCDRDFLKNNIGYTSMTKDDVPKIINFINYLTNNNTEPMYMISFFGGEPFVFVSMMNEIIQELTNRGYNTKFLIQTNGSLILKNKDFIERWNKKLHISISYDFAFQEINRTVFDIDATLELLKKNINHIQLQHVIPVNRKDCFTVDKLAAIVKIYEKHQLDRLSLIPLRHIRGNGRFKTFIDDVPPADVFKKMVQFVQLLHIYNINVVIDGMVSSIEKSYFNEHKQLVIAPDGYLYPEFDFVEYKVENARIGEWKNNIIIEPVKNDDALIHNQCISCKQRNKCGIKYLYKLWAEKPDDKCELISTMYETLIRHLFKLKETNLFEVIGIK